MLDQQTQTVIVWIAVSLWILSFQGLESWLNAATKEFAWLRRVMAYILAFLVAPFIMGYWAALGVRDLFRMLWKSGS